MNNIIKILIGLNSKVFNYIENHKEELQIGDIPIFDTNDEVQISTMGFMQSCVRINRPCILNNMAKEWNITKQLQNETLIGILDGLNLDYYTDVENPEPLIPSRGWSFASKNQDQAKIDSKTELPQINLIKSQSQEITDRLRDYIKVPEFYDEIQDLQNIEVFSGNHFIDRPQYQRDEQFFCAVKGSLSFVMVPHIFRHEVYAGKLQNSLYFDPNQEDVNISPVNFWIQYTFQFPFFGRAQKQIVNLNQGDCVFIPAFYFYHMQGFHELTSPENRQFPQVFEHEKEVGGTANQNYIKLKNRETYSDEIATAISLKYEGNSELLGDFIDAIENEHIH